MVNKALKFLGGNQWLIRLSRVILSKTDGCFSKVFVGDEIRSPVLWGLFHKP